jgi:hypothetical protein
MWMMTEVGNIVPTSFEFHLALVLQSQDLENLHQVLYQQPTVSEDFLMTLVSVLQSLERARPQEQQQWEGLLV